MLVALQVVKNLQILIVSQYFWPESFIINDLVKTLVSQGHMVEVLTGKPNYPDGKIFEGYTAEGCMDESFDEGVTVHRAPLYPRGESGAKNLFRNYFSFVFNGLKYFHRSVKGQSFDVIFVFAPSPVLQVIPAIYLKFKMKVHLALWIQDLWPESLKATGYIRNPLMLSAIGWLVRGLYALTDTLLIQSRAFHNPVSRYARSGKIAYFPNSYQDFPHEIDSETQIPQAVLDLMTKYFCLVFAGNLGKAQSLETLVQAAENLKHLPEVKLIVVGSGSMEEWLKQQVASKELDNLVLVGRFPSNEMPQFFSRADGLLVTLRKEEIFAYTIPSKIQAYLAAGCPIVAALDGEGAKVIAEAGAGLTCPAEDFKGLAQRIGQLYKMSAQEREKLGCAGRAYYLEHFEMKRQCSRLVEILQGRIAAARKGKK
ncbi:MAG: glycosyltransferase involved in cell wall biosynthesis [Chitinophagales bacterium]|jgi:glycosyltransferase involved in cell wall biosynthesis